jgi:RNA polymerase sigma factor (sigma-70 family)
VVNPNRDDLEAEFLRLLPRIERICRFAATRVGLFGADAEDLASHVKLRLIENDYRILREFRGRATIETYLSTVIVNLARDYKIGLTVKWRPSAVAERLGVAAVMLERLLIREGRTLDEACDEITTNHRVPISRAELERLAGQLPPRFVRQLISDDALAAVPAGGASPDEALIADEHRASVARVRAVLQQVRLTMPSQDQVILAMRYEDGLAIAEIADALRIERRLLYRRLEGIHKRLRRELEAAGIDPEVLAWFESQT